MVEKKKKQEQGLDTLWVYCPPINNNELPACVEMSNDPGPNS